MSKEDSIHYREFTRPFFDERDTAHNSSHIERMFNRLEILSEGISPAPRVHVLNFLVSFHGLWEIWNNDLCFRDKAIDFLSSLGWDDQEIGEAARLLERHMRDPQTSEEKIVYDANACELLGAFGVAKAFTVGGALGQTYEQTAEIYERRYLDRVEFQTPAGRRLAEEGKNFPKEFLARLKTEL